MILNQLKINKSEIVLNHLINGLHFFAAVYFFKHMDQFCFKRLNFFEPGTKINAVAKKVQKVVLTSITLLPVEPSICITD